MEDALEWEEVNALELERDQEWEEQDAGWVLLLLFAEKDLGFEKLKYIFLNNQLLLN